jgi:hypothetical protein
MPFDPSIIAGAAGGGTGTPPVDSSLKGYTGTSGLGSTADPSDQAAGSFNVSPGALSAGMGLVQMAVGLSQLRRAKRLPFPGYLASKGPLAEMKSLYQSQMKEGIGSQQRGIMRMQGAQQMGQQMNAISQNAAQGSQLLGRTAALNRTGTEARIASADLESKQSSMSGMERMNRAMTAIEQKDIAAKREYRMTAERAAGQAIKRGSENIAEFASGDKTSNKK